MKVGRDELRMRTYRLAQDSGLSPSPRAGVEHSFSRARADKLRDALAPLFLNDEFAFIEAWEAAGIAEISPKDGLLRELTEGELGFGTRLGDPLEKLRSIGASPQRGRRDRTAEIMAISLAKALAEAALKPSR